MGEPNLACRLRMTATSVDVKLASSHPSGSDWIPIGELHLKQDDSDPTSTKSTSEKPANPRVLVLQVARRLGVVAQMDTVCLEPAEDVVKHVEEVDTNIGGDAA